MAKAAENQFVIYDVAIEDRFEHLMDVGSGVFGSVFKAHDKKMDRVVAVKKIKTDLFEDTEHQGIPTSVLREVSVLRDLKHPNVVPILNLHIAPDLTFSLVFEYVERDLYSILKQHRKGNQMMPMGVIQKYMQELFNGLHACHVRLIMHRDLKPQNILIGKDGLKIADFGLARIFSPDLRVYTHDVITLWYRAPEVLMGAPKYGREVDVWSAGCIMDEMLCGNATFPGNSEIGTIFQMFKLLGTPTEVSWPDRQNLEHWSNKFPWWKNSHLQRLRGARPEITEDCVNLVTSCLLYNPQTRIVSRKAKMHAFFQQKVDFKENEWEASPTEVR